MATSDQELSAAQRPTGLAEHTHWAIAAACIGMVVVVLLVWRAAEVGTALGHQIDLYFSLTAILTIVCVGFSRVHWRIAQMEWQAKLPESGGTSGGA